MNSTYLTPFVIAILAGLVNVVLHIAVKYAAEKFSFLQILFSGQILILSAIGFTSIAMMLVLYAHQIGLEKAVPWMTATTIAIATIWGVIENKNIDSISTFFSEMGFVDAMLSSCVILLMACKIIKVF